MVVLGSGTGGSGPGDVEGLLYSGSPGGPHLWGGDLGLHPEDGEGPGQFSFQGREDDHWKETSEKEIRELGIPTAGGGKEGSGNGGDTDIHNTEAEYGRAIYCDATDYGPMRAGHSAARSASVLAVVGAGRDRPGGSAETGGGIDDEVGDGVRGGVGRGAERDRGRRQGGVSGSERVQWIGVEQGGGWIITHLDLRRVSNTTGKN